MKINLNSIPKILSTSPTKILSLDLLNPNSVDAYIKIYDAPKGTVVGVSASARVIQVPAQSSITIKASDLKLSTKVGLTVAATTGYLDSSSTALSNDLICVFNI